MVSSGAAVLPTTELISCPAALGCPAAKSVAVEDPGTLVSVLIVKLLAYDVAALAALADEADIEDRTCAGSGAFGPCAMAGTLPTCFCCELTVCVSKGWAASPLAVRNDPAAIWPVGSTVVEVSLRARGCLDAMDQY